MPTDTQLNLSAWVRPGDTILWGQAHAQPLTLIETLVKQRHSLGRVRVFLGIGHDLQDVLKPEHTDGIDFSGYCGAGSNRTLCKAGVLDILPVHYAEMARRFRDGTLRVDVVFLQLPRPDAQGRYSLGMAREYLVAAIESARIIIAEEDETLPWTYGGPYLERKAIDVLVPTVSRQVPALPAASGTAELAIGRHVASLVPDGATLQTGIGNMPDAVLSALKGHRDLGVHSGSLGDGIAMLSACGVITNSRKTIDAGITVGGMLFGGELLRRHAHMNTALELRRTEYTHGAETLAQLKRFVAINSAVEVDLTGQVNSEYAGGVYVGGVGGALDFLRGAIRSEGGIPIVALPSTARNRSRIVASLSGPVTVPRSDACVIVTEHGVADLRGLTVAQRVRRMIAVSDPAHRDALEREAKAIR